MARPTWSDCVASVGVYVWSHVQARAVTAKPNCPGMDPMAGAFTPAAGGPVVSPEAQPGVSSMLAARIGETYSPRERLLTTHLQGGSLFQYAFARSRARFGIALPLRTRGCESEP